MARAGRKPKAGKREASGRLQRPSREEMKRIEQIKREGEKAVVLMQPHRRGDARQECASAFGRFILRMPEQHRAALTCAGDEYARIVRGWRVAKGVPATKSVGEPGAGLGPSDETVEKWQKKMVDADHAMQAVSHEGRLYVRQLVLDEYDIGMDQEGDAQIAIWALGVHFGMVRESLHPFGCG